MHGISAKYNRTSLHMCTQWVIATSPWESLVSGPLIYRIRGDEAGKQNGCREDNYKHEWPKIHERRVVDFGRTRYEQPVSEDKTSGVAGEQSEPAEREQRPEELVGLVLSGGGLRSALFNDGFLQALSHKGLLRYVDYLCSVSGGGYIAGHLMTFSGGKPAEVKTEGTES